MRPVLSTMLCLLLLTACGDFQVNLPDRSQLVSGEADYATYAKAKRYASAYWGRRHKDPAQKENITNAITNWEKAWAIDGTDRDVLQHLAVAHYYLGLYFTEDEEERRAVYGKGWEYGKLAAFTNPKIKAAWEQDKEQIHKAIAAHATVGDVPGIYWLAVNWARVMEDASLPKKAIASPKIKAIMETVYKLGESYFGFAVHRFFGAYYCKAPGQSDPGNQSKEAFQTAIDRFPGNLENKVLMAQYHCVLVDDEELFDKLLQDVLDAPADFGPADFRFDNFQAKIRAQKLIDTKYDGDLF